jgi:glucose uptake protein GlcU
LRYTGLILLPFAAFVAYIAARENPPRPAIWAIIIANALWVVGSIVLLLSEWVTPNALGVAFIIAQALIVAILAELQYLGVRKNDESR